MLIGAIRVIANSQQFKLAHDILRIDLVGIRQRRERELSLCPVEGTQAIGLQHK